MKHLLFIILLFVVSCKKNIVNVTYMSSGEKENLVIENSPVKLLFQINPTNTLAAQSINPKVSILLVDSKNQVVKRSGVSISLAIGNDPSNGVSSLSGITSVNSVDGVASFENLSIDKAFEGYTLIASSNDLGSVESTSFNIAVGPAVAIKFDKTPKDTVVGHKLNPEVLVNIVDAGGNTVSSASDIVTVEMLEDPSGDATLNGSLSQNTVNGVATFDNLIIDKIAQGYKLKTTSTSFPEVETDVFNILKAYSLSTGFIQTCVNMNGSVKCFGQGDAFELGNGQRDSTIDLDPPGPVLVQDHNGQVATDINSIFFSAFADTACSILDSSQVRCMGRGASGQRADGTITNTPLPTFFQTSDGVNLSNVVKVSTGGNVTCAITNTNKLFCSGENSPSNSFLLNGNACQSLADENSCTSDSLCRWNASSNTCFNNSTVKFAVEVASDILDVAVGSRFMCVKETLGNVKCWGKNSAGQLGNNTTDDVVGYNNAINVVGIDAGSVVDLRAGSETACVQLNNNTVKCWGGGFSGSLGINSQENQKTAQLVLNSQGDAPVNNIIKMAVGSNHNCYIDTQRDVFCVGDNLDGQLGEDAENKELLLYKTPKVSHAIDISVGDFHSCVLNSNNEVFCWGSNIQGESGHFGDSTPTPIKVLNL